MNSIYASKLYRASKRKDKIYAALVNSANAGLVQQLSEDLDEKFQEMNKETLESRKAEQNNKDDNSQSAQQEDENGIPKSLSSGLSGGSFNPATDLMPYPEEGEGSESPEGDVTEGDVGDDSQEPEEDIQESVDITASTLLDEDELNVLKNGLNLTAELAGVTRVVDKDHKEIWIYYNDDTNLNNIMTDVIEYVVRRYSQVDFNRLARSDNAIVFEIVTATNSDETVKDADEK